MTTSCYWILLLLLCRHVAEAKTVAGTIQSSSELQYIAKFCWSAAGSGPEAGIFSGRLTAQVPLQDTLGQTAMPLFLLYDGGEDSWPATYGRATSCHSKVRNCCGFWRDTRRDCCRSYSIQQCCCFRSNLITSLPNLSVFSQCNSPYVVESLQLIACGMDTIEA